LVHKLEFSENNTIIQSSLNLRGRMALTITVKRIWVPPGAAGAGFQHLGLLIFSISLA
jgi:hypothetical protein